MNLHIINNNEQLLTPKENYILTEANNQAVHASYDTLQIYLSSLPKNIQAIINMGIINVSANQNGSLIESDQDTSITMDQLCKNLSTAPIQLILFNYPANQGLINHYQIIINLDYQNIYNVCQQIGLQNCQPAESFYDFITQKCSNLYLLVPQLRNLADCGFHGLLMALKIANALLLENDLQIANALQIANHFDYGGSKSTRKNKHKIITRKTRKQRKVINNKNKKTRKHRKNKKKRKTINK